ncbi:MAG: hypothetical protein IT424_01540 [Pirellulales bacterium]|nr:hypothetical protein [Pirellulales bacterium]
MRLGSRQRALMGLAAVILLLAAGGRGAATEPVRISYHRVAGNPIVCTSDTTPALYDVGAPPEGATEMVLPFMVGNNSGRTVTDVVITLTGSEVPGVFWISYTNNRGYISANSGCSVSVKFRPLAGDASGTVYGGEASKVKLRVTYNYKPDKGPKRAGTPLELVIQAHKR